MTDRELLEDAAQAARFEQIWECKIGGKVYGLPKSCDEPMRSAVQKCFYQLFGCEAEFVFSGWSGSLSEGERAVVENRPAVRARCTVELPMPAPGFKWALVVDHDAAIGAAK